MRLLFARRYLFAHKSHSVINFITLLSVVAVAIPVAAMVILLSVYNGFEGIVERYLSAFDAELTIQHRTGGAFPIDSLLVGDVEGVAALSYTLEGEAMIQSEGRQHALKLRGIQPNYVDVLPLDDYLTAGVSDVWSEVSDSTLARVVIGTATAYKLGVRTLGLNDIDLYAVSRTSFSTLLPFDGYVHRRAKICGAFEVNDENSLGYAFTSLEVAQQLFGYPNRASAVAVGVDPAHDLKRTQQRLQRAVGEGFVVKDRYELDTMIYKLMLYEKWAMFVILGLVMIISSLSIVGAMAMLVIDKRDDSQTLSAMGASLKLRRSIFEWEGWLICASGCVVGLLLGLGVCFAQQQFGLVRLPVSYADNVIYPVEIMALDMLAIITVMAVVSVSIVKITVRTMIK